VEPALQEESGRVAPQWSRDTLRDEISLLLPEMEAEKGDEFFAIPQPWSAARGCCCARRVQSFVLHVERGAATHGELV
jgi:hypothetical protein